MKKIVLLGFILILTMIVNAEDLKNNPFVKALTPKIKGKTIVRVYRVKVEGKTYTHPQSFTRKQANKILHSIKTTEGVPVLVLNELAIRKAIKPFIEEFKKAKPDEMVVIEKDKKYLNAKDQKTLMTKKDILYFGFPDKDHLLIFYKPEGYDRARLLREGFHVHFLTDKKGKKYMSTIIMNRDVWEKYINRAVFEQDYEQMWEKTPKSPDEKPDTTKENLKKNQNQAGTLSIEEMEKELEKLKNMLDKKLITEEEYNKLREKILKKAGL